MIEANEREEIADRTESTFERAGRVLTALIWFGVGVLAACMGMLLIFAKD